MIRPSASMTENAVLPNEAHGLSYNNDVAVIWCKMPLYGFMYDMIRQEIRRANNDPLIKSILIDIDTPGGQGYECSETAEIIRSSKKPVVAYVAGEASSAGYWLASAAQKIVAHRSAYVGSIGTYCYVWGQSDSEKIVVSSLSPVKVPDASNNEDIERIRSHMDDMTRIFIDDVARYRGTDSANVLANWGKGDIIKAENALQLGMIDSIGNYASAFTLARQMSQTNVNQNIGGTYMKSSKGFFAVRGSQLAPHSETIESEDITVEWLKEKMPELVTVIVEDAKKEMEAKNKETEEVAAMADETDETEKAAAKSLRMGEISKDVFMKKLIDIRAEKLKGPESLRQKMINDVTTGNVIPDGVFSGTGSNPAPTSGVALALMKMRKKGA